MATETLPREDDVDCFSNTDARSASKRHTAGLLTSASKRQALAPLTNLQAPVGNKMLKKAPQKEETVCE